MSFTNLWRTRQYIKYVDHDFGQLTQSQNTLDVIECVEKNVMAKIIRTRYFIVVRPQNLVITYVHLNCYWCRIQRSDQRTRVQWVSPTSEEQYNISDMIALIHSLNSNLQWFESQKSPSLIHLPLFIGSRKITLICYRYSFLNNRILRKSWEITSDMIITA